MTFNREKLVTLIAITEATRGLSYPMRKGTLTRALTLYPSLAPDCKSAPILTEHTVWEIQRNGPYSDWHSRF